MTTPADDSPATPGGATVPPSTGPGAPAPAGPGGTPTTGLGVPSPAGSAASSVPPGPAGVPSLPSQTGGAAVPPTATVVVGSYADYALAQQAVDHLSDNKFPVERTAIIGTDLRLVENVLGRLTTARAAGAGLASGAWFGLLIGLLLGIFSNSNWFAVIFVCLLIGAAWGAIFGAIAHAATGGRRDFASRSSLQAGQYAVTTDPEVADQARSLLVQLNWNASGAE
ncbi:general stress protein [Actinoplanes sp. NPDC051411]|uniref:general stress protein n=1 Tax=Actinoplanes sp. NPDC051411 TaxID=3155522 RepID=UPI0034435280